VTISIQTADAVLGSSATVIASSSASGQFVILKASVTNTDSAAHTVTLYRVPQSGSAGTTNIFGADALSVGAGSTAVLPVSGQGLANGQTLQALADTAAVVNINLTLAQVIG
jgi:hypothetical protein